MSKPQTPRPRTDRSTGQDPLPVRWALIVIVAAAVGVLLGQEQGLAPGILAAGGSAVALHALVGDKRDGSP